MNVLLNAVAIKTIVRKEMVRVLRIWVQTIVPPAITMTLYFIIFGNLIGRRIGTMDGFDYMQFIAPGLIMMSVITNSYGNVVSSFFGAKFGRHIEEMLVSPMSYATIIIGHVAGGVLQVARPEIGHGLHVGVVGIGQGAVAAARHKIAQGAFGPQVFDEPAVFGRAIDVKLVQIGLHRVVCVADAQHRVH